MLFKLLVLFQLLVVILASVDEYHYDPNIFELTPNTFNKVVEKTNYTTIVKFYAPWCGHCRNLKPTYQKLGKLIHQDGKYAINVAAVNCDQEFNKPLCARYQIQGFPTLMVFRPPKYVPGEQDPRKQRHASEVYYGERSAKAMAEFLTSRLKNYVKKFPTVKSDSLKEWLNNEGHKVLLISDKKSISPLYKSLAIDFLSKVNFGMVSNTFVDDHIVEVNGNKVEILGSGDASLLYYDEKTGKMIRYDKGKLNDLVSISQWIIDVTGVAPKEGTLSKKEEKYYSKYRKGESVEKKKKSKSSSEKSTKSAQDHDEL